MGSWAKAAAPASSRGTLHVAIRVIFPMHVEPPGHGKGSMAAAASVDYDHPEAQAEKGEPVPGYERIETASIDELRALQLTRLQWSVRHAYENVAHYRRAFDTAGVHPADLRSLDDLAWFPFTVKSDLRE